MPYRKAMNVATPIKTRKNHGQFGLSARLSLGLAALEVDLTARAGIGRVRGRRKHLYGGGDLRQGGRYAERSIIPAG